MTDVTGVFTVIFALIWSGVALFLDFDFGLASWKQYQSSSYSAADGTITHSSVRVSYRSKGRTRYSPDFTYTYQVGSQIYKGSRYRFGQANASQSYVTQIVASNPVGTPVIVYYDPQNPAIALLVPGFNGRDLEAVLLLTPFNAIMLLCWMGAGSALRERMFRPAAGGMKLIVDGTNLRVRLPQYPPIIWGILTVIILGFVSYMLVNIFNAGPPSIPVVTGAIIAVYGIAFILWLWQWQIVSTGVDDLVINKYTRTLVLPMTFGREKCLRVAMNDVQAIWVDKVERRTNKGGISYTYAPSLYLPGTEPSFQKLANWEDKLRADDFAQWLSQQINVPIKWSDPADRLLEPASPPFGAPGGL